MLQNEVNPEESATGLRKLLDTTSRNLKAIGAGWQVFVRAVEKITFSKEAVHIPDQKLIDEVVQLLLTGDNAKRHD